MIISKKNTKLKTKYLQTKNKYLYLLQKIKQPIKNIEKLNSKYFKNYN